MLRYVIQISLLLLVALLAWKYGRKAERHVSAIYLAMFVATTAYAQIAGRWADYDVIPVYRVAVDVVGLLLLFRVVAGASEWWVLWVASAQTVAVIAHVLRLSGQPLPPLIYAVMERWPIWLALVLTGYGTMRSIAANRHRA